MAFRDDLTVPQNQSAGALEADDGAGKRSLNRRQFVQSGALSALSLVPGFERLYALPGEDLPAGKFVSLVDFEDEGVAPVGTPIGTELDGRLYTDLSRLSQRRLVTPSAEFYIRTAASRLLPDSSQWKVSLKGLVEHPSALDIQALRGAAKPMGLHLMECAGNVRLTRFGLISVANWSSVPISAILDDARRKTDASWVQVSGFDDYASPSATSIPGASWIFPLEELKAAGAFLATAMNGQMLTGDHGAPVRLVVPGWYGCACIKWVTSIAVVDDGAEATSQMKEYAARTLQEGIPQLAKDFQPATIDHAAMPVRVEKWIVSGKPRYRVVGILWGGSQAVATLQIRFNPDKEFVPVKGFRQVKADPWTIWTHTWSPQAPGRYSIRLAVTDPPVRARKLDSGYYVRSVNISEV